MSARMAPVFLAAAAAAAQTAAPAPVMRGTLLEWEGSRSAGELSVRTPANNVYRFTFDSRTYFERDSRASSADRLRQGDLVEVVSDTAAGALLRYARTVHVIEPEAAPKPVPRPGRYRLSTRTPLDPIMPLGNLTFAGVVRRLGDGRMVLRTRSQGEQMIVLRQDTRYLEDGVQVPASALAPSTLVFVRGSRNFEDEVEAYQVVWGRILEPEKRP